MRSILQDWQHPPKSKIGGEKKRREKYNEGEKLFLLKPFS